MGKRVWFSNIGAPRALLRARRIKDSSWELWELCLQMSYTQGSLQRTCLGHRTVSCLGKQENRGKQEASKRERNTWAICSSIIQQAARENTSEAQAESHTPFPAGEWTNCKLELLSLSISPGKSSSPFHLLPHRCSSPAGAQDTIFGHSPAGVTQDPVI